MTRLYGGSAHCSYDLHIPGLVWVEFAMTTHHIGCGDRDLGRALGGWRSCVFLLGRIVCGSGSGCCLWCLRLCDMARYPRLQTLTACNNTVLLSHQIMSQAAREAGTYLVTRRNVPAPVDIHDGLSSLVKPYSGLLLPIADTRQSSGRESILPANGPFGVFITRLLMCSIQRCHSFHCLWRRDNL